MAEAGGARRANRSRRGPGADRPHGAGRGAARRGQRAVGARQAPGQRRRGDRGRPHQQLCQRPARAPHRGDRPGAGLRRAGVPVVRGAPRDPGIRTHQHDGGERLHPARRGHLSSIPRAGPAPPRDPRPAPDHAVERRGHGGRRRRRAPREHHRIRAFRRRRRRGGDRPEARLRERPHLRHGRNDGQGGDDRRRLLRPGRRARRRGGHQLRGAVSEGRRLSRERSRHRHRGGRGGRRQPRAD